MRPYLAIIVDSFRAAVASRVLYIMLLLISLLFLVIAPINLKETVDWKVGTRRHMTKPESVVKRLIEKGQSGKTKHVVRLWSLLSPDMQQQVQTVYEEINSDQIPESNQEVQTRNGFYRSLVNEFNEVLVQRDFYRKDDWGRFSITTEAKELISQGVDSLSDEQMRRLNRVLLAKALPSLEKPNGSTVTAYYWFYTYDPYWTFPSSRSTVSALVAQLTTFFFDKILLSVGILVGILITANIVPQTFDPGSLNLLLSKPVTRTGLYLSRFLGGCSQVAICSAYLFFGTWLWLGLGIGLWDTSFLWSIPIYVLVFAIYFSVSALVGLLYRSPILSIVATIVFWAACFFVGSTYNSFDAMMENQRIYDPMVAGDSVVAVDSLGNAVQWNVGRKNWQIAGEAEGPIGPEKTAIAMAQWFDKLKIYPFQIRPVEDSQGQIHFGLAHSFPPEQSVKSNLQGFVSTPGNPPVPTGSFPRSTIAMHRVKDGFVMVNRSGRLGFWDPKAHRQPYQTALGPEKPIPQANTYSSACNPSTGEIATHQHEDGEHRIVVFRRDQDEYVLDRSQVIDIGTSKKMNCFVAFAGDSIVVIPGNNSNLVLDANTLQPRDFRFTCETTCGIETIATDPNGQFIGLLYANRSLWLMDVNGDNVFKPSVTGQGNVSSIAFDQQGRMCVVDQEQRLSVYQPDGLTIENVYVPSDGVLALAYRYLVSPLYTVFPKPGEMYKVINHLSSSRDTRSDPSVDLIFNPTNQNPMLPFWSGLGFMVFMLALSCAVFNTKDY